MIYELESILEINNIICDNQQGFRNKKSTWTNLLDYLHDLTKLAHQSLSISIVYTDFKKKHLTRYQTIYWFTNWSYTETKENFQVDKEFLRIKNSTSRGTELVII